jgi:hypothetical protein
MLHLIKVKLEFYKHKYVETVQQIVIHGNIRIYNILLEIYNF